jgi:predicted transcriptional regulator
LRGGGGLVALGVACTGGLAAGERAFLLFFFMISFVPPFRYLSKLRRNWVVFMLDAVAETSVTTNGLVIGIRDQMAATKRRMRDELPRLYSQDLLNNLFRHPYTRIEYVQNDLNVTRQTAAKYLDTLAEQGFVEKHRSGKSNYYINVALVRLFLDASGKA